MRLKDIAIQLAKLYSFYGSADGIFFCHLTPVFCWEMVPGIYAVAGFFCPSVLKNVSEKTRDNLGRRRARNEFGIGILIIGANLYGGVYKLIILIRETLKDFLQNFSGFWHRKSRIWVFCFVSTSLVGFWLFCTCFRKLFKQKTKRKRCNKPSWNLPRKTRHCNQPDRLISIW